MSASSSHWLSETSDPDAVEWVQLLCALVGELTGVWTSVAALTMEWLIQVDTTGLETKGPSTGSARSTVMSVWMSTFKTLGLKDGSSFQDNWKHTRSHSSSSCVRTCSSPFSTNHHWMRPKASCLCLRLIDPWSPMLVSFFRAEEIAPGVAFFRCVTRNYKRNLGTH